MQMIGRAGRPQFDTSAIAIIMTSQNLRLRYENLCSGHRPLESHLHLKLSEHLNSEIVLETIQSIDQAVSWLKSTFLYVRMVAFPIYYQINLPSADNALVQSDPSSIETLISNHLYDLCVRVLSMLDSTGLILFQKDSHSNN